jgi:hypothetical protein
MQRAEGTTVAESPMIFTRLQRRIARDRTLFWGGLVLFAGLVFAVVGVSPPEKTLGSGIRSVYIHVGLSVAGALGILVAGLLGLVAAAFGRPTPQKWSNTIAWVGVAFFIAGFVASVIAAHINWGAFFWQEPRTVSALRIIALGLIVQTIGVWNVPYRLQGLLTTALAVFLYWALETTPLVLHPRNAARDSTSQTIQLIFLAVLVLCLLASAWIALRLRSSRFLS